MKVANLLPLLSLLFLAFRPAEAQCGSCIAAAAECAVFCSCDFPACECCAECGACLLDHGEDWDDCCECIGLCNGEPEFVAADPEPDMDVTDHDCVYPTVGKAKYCIYVAEQLAKDWNSTVQWEYEGESRCSVCRAAAGGTNVADPADKKNLVAPPSPDGVGGFNGVGGSDGVKENCLHSSTCGLDNCEAWAKELFIKYNKTVDWNYWEYESECHCTACIEDEGAGPEDTEPKGTELKGPKYKQDPTSGGPGCLHFKGMSWNDCLGEVVAYEHYYKLTGVNCTYHKTSSICNICPFGVPIPSPAPPAPSCVTAPVEPTDPPVHNASYCYYSALVQIQRWGCAVTWKFDNDVCTICPSSGGEEEEEKGVLESDGALYSTPITKSSFRSSSSSFSNNPLLSPEAVRTVGPTGTLCFQLLGKDNVTDVGMQACTSSCQNCSQACQAEGHANYCCVAGSCCCYDSPSILCATDAHCPYTTC